MEIIDDLGVPARLLPALRALLAAAEGEERIRACWLGGSLARGIGDDWSDIDLHLAVDTGLDPVDWVGSALPLVLADAIPGVSGGFLFLTPDWVHVDVIAHPVEGLEQTDHPAVPLLDRDGLVRRVEPAPDAAGEPYCPVDQVRIFLYFMGHAVTVLHRGELVAMSQGTAMMRDQLLVPLMLAENGVRKADGAKRLNRYLTADQLAELAALPAVGLGEESLRLAQQVLAGCYLTRARRLADRCGVDHPADLEAAVLDLWRRELGFRLLPTPTVP